MDDMICGKLLGDGCLVKQSGRKPRFQFIHSVKDAGWNHYCYEQLAEFLPLNPPKYRKIYDQRVGSGFTECYFVQSHTSEELIKLYELWYPHGKKQLPFSYIENHFTEKTFAWWYQDDGHYHQQNGIPRKIILSTDSFSIKENHFLINFLQKKYDLRFSADAQNRLILYDQFQIIYFLHLVGPYIQESMNRKKWLPAKPKKIAERTTIYLPTDLVITKPTAEINEQYTKLPLLATSAENPLEFFKQYTFLKRSTLSSKSYQIKINDDSREILRQLRHQTGLTVSQLTTCCFLLQDH